MSLHELARRAVEEQDGVLRLAPAWVPRSFCRPGMRLKLHPADTYALGLARGGIDERWLASTTRAENGPGTPADEGLSYVVLADGAEILLRDAVVEQGEALLGRDLWRAHGGWPIYSKFFDNMGPLPHHVHHDDLHARRVGQAGKPEMYFFPAQMNNHGGEFAHTYFGLNPGTTREQVRRALADFPKGDNGLLALSRAYALALDTGWDVPPGLLHAPGSLCTYEPQFASDVYAMYQSVLLGGHVVPEELLWKDCPPEEKGNIDYLLDVLDWEGNVDPDFYRHRHMAPRPILGEADACEAGWQEEKICYLSEAVSARRLTVAPGRRALIRNAGAYGFIAIQGRGLIDGLPIEVPTLIRFGQRTFDEYFVSFEAAARGVWIENTSACEPLVLLKHFAGGADC